MSTLNLESVPIDEKLWDQMKDAWESRTNDSDGQERVAGEFLRLHGAACSDIRAARRIARMLIDTFAHSEE